MHRDDKIHFILTGGTIDKKYDPVSQVNIMNEESVIPDFIKNQIQANIDYGIETLCMIDSLEFTDELRGKLKDAVMATNAKNIIVTHGTDTVTLTAEYLIENLPQDHGKTITLTGSPVPINGFYNSSGGFNLGFAIASATLLPAGVYVCMNAHIFEAGTVTKNLKTARFEDK